MSQSSLPGPNWPIGFGATCLRALLYILLIGALAQGAYLEALHLSEASFSERGFTEQAESVVLLITAALLLYVRQALRQLPTVTLLMLAFVCSAFIREQDAWLDAHVFDGAWQLLVTLVILPSLYGVIHQRRRFLEEFTRYSNSFSFGLFAAGVLTTLIFSRLYGRGAFWEATMGEHYVRAVKDASEEVVELFGFALILIAVIELALLARRWVMARHAI